ncbi:MAG: quinone-dependent dihydroorotate dehydrogenase [Gammaproteobacteria bacterium]|nr:quinone-dependent dihydroorotate dehydrogenase [Gammaproteobacteria bacterium]
MLSYHLLRSILFMLDAEQAHELSLKSLKLLHAFSINPYKIKTPNTQPLNCMGLTFPNRVGLAAGLDKNGDYIDALGSLGFGFIEVGTVTPRPQPGNPRPRIFRLPQAEAIINRMGFNNKGIDHLIEQVKKRKYSGILGINIGKNFDTPIENAVDDYLIGLEKAYPYADYITVNISSPNTKNLRQLQEKAEMEKLLSVLKSKQQQLEMQHQTKVPLLIKIAPDLSDDAIAEMADLFLQYEIDGVIATNTTISREQVQQYSVAKEAGGLSGKPVFNASNHVIAELNKRLANNIPIVGVGGISHVNDAKIKIQSGASLVQVYSGFIYQGPALIKSLVNAILP